MLRFLSAAITTALIFLASYGLGSTLAASTDDTTGKTIPQGQDPPGADDDQTIQPPAEHKGVIKPPPVGDEGIYTKAPNPEAGHQNEVIPTPGSPGGDPNIEPR
jgi:hypothetical protein